MDPYCELVFDRHGAEKEVQKMNDLEQRAREWIRHNLVEGGRMDKGMADFARQIEREAVKGAFSDFCPTCGHEKHLHGKFVAQEHGCASCLINELKEARRATVKTPNCCEGAKTMTDDERLLRDAVRLFKRAADYFCGNCEGTPCDDMNPVYVCEYHRWLKEAREYLRGRKR